MNLSLAAAPDPLTIPTFILAVLGFVGAVVALIWQFVTFRLSGSRIRIEVHLNHQDAQRKLFHPARPWWKFWGKLETLKTPLVGENFQIKVRSIGRMPVIITDCVLQAWAKNHYARTAGRPNRDFESFPTRIEPGDFEVWRFNTGLYSEYFNSELAKNPTPILEYRIQAVVALGNGRDYRTRPIVVPLSSR